MRTRNALYINLKRIGGFIRILEVSLESAKLEFWPFFSCKVSHLGKARSFKEDKEEPLTGKFPFNPLSVVYQPGGARIMSGLRNICMAYVKMKP